MNTQDDGFTIKILARAMQVALLALLTAPIVVAAQETAAQKAAEKAVADEAAAEEGEGDVKALTCPTNYVEIGAMNVSKAATKFGEYTGLDSSGIYGIGNFDVRGGNAYCQSGGDTRWQASGNDLGTTSRSVGVNVSAQGRWNFGYDFDQLRHYTTTGYQTPLQGSSGDNVFLLSPSFGVINTTAPGGAQVLTPGQLAAFHPERVYNERDSNSLTVGYIFNPQWSFKFDFKRLDESGSKLSSTATDAYNLTSSGGFNYGGQRILMLMNPMEYKNDTFNLALNWVGANAYASLEYYASLFRDSYNGVSFSNPFVAGGTAAAPSPLPGAAPDGAFPLNTMSTPPSNQLHQINFTGGYIFSPATKLTGGFSFGRNTQNMGFDGTYTAVPNTMPTLPVSSLNGRVVTKHADVRLTHQFTPALNLNVGFKYNERDNQTASNTYTFLDLAGAAMTAVNIPMSNKREQFDAALDWRIDPRQRLHFGYEYEKMERWCNNALANNAQGSLSAANASYYVVASCVQVPKSTENKLVATYRLKFSDKVDFNAGYTYADRSADVNPSFYNPMQANNQGFENYGFLAFFQASRRENLLKAGVTWQAAEKFSLGLNGRYAQDEYYDSALGVRSGNTDSANLDANYSVSENISFGGYVSWQKRTRNMLTASGRNAVAPLNTLWSNYLADRDNTIGVNGKQKGLLHGKLELNEDLTYGLSKSKYYTNLVQNIAPAVGNSGTSPNILSELTQLRVVGTYELSQTSHVTVGYLYQRLKSSDYFYSAYQYGFNPTAMISTNQQAPNYSVNTVFAVYRYSFR
jgi:MtrB/PioB family decaheme-associated outer membrane protein